ncbi:phosphatidate cytidylyltransferase [Tunturiibacter gelidoferens]|uniref:Phosphatidate cytidylyltransferase n=1 Tax=Tunturiibacter lichenicola TaxID=2051959 RepID=A0A7Y9NP15_9BACT|nr:phosphatidate cytidylyltransferase [Edaphobacter lichenicola]NYF52924.1 phosphatidate cytidylyltransferase [Edaphobacter lichenicola]
MIFYDPIYPVQDFMKRVLTATVLILAVFALIFFGQLWMITLFSAIVAELAAYEYLKLASVGAEAHGAKLRIPIWWMTLGTALAFVVTLPNVPVESQLPVLSGLTLILFAWNGFRAPLIQVLPDTAQGLFGLIYIAYPLTLVPLLWKQEDGPALVLFLMVCVWAGDIAALYIGRAFGKRKLAPRLSPGKTWAGSIASIVGSVIAASIVIAIADTLTAHGNTLLHISEPLWQSLLLAAILNIAAQLGDLLESAIKRGAGVKDSGTMLPGHGGILDRIDALLLAAPVLWYVLLLKDYFGLGRF